MKLKFSLGEGGLKGFFTHHAEKAIFGVVLALVAFFVYTSATQTSDVSSDSDPEDLKRQAGSAKGHLSNNYWDAIAPEREKTVRDYPGRAKVARSPIDEMGYTLPNPLDRPLIPKKSKRGDPEILAPVQVEAGGAVYSVAMRANRNEGDPWADDKPAVVKTEEQPKPRRKRKKKSRRSTGGGDEDAMMGMMYGSGEGGGEDGGFNPYGSGMEDGMEGGMEEGGMLSGPSGTASAMGTARKLDKFYIEHYIKGYRSASSGGMRPSGVLGRSFAVVAVKALVPYEKQWEEYERALAHATGYSPGQDIPSYLYFLAERAEVSPDPDAPLAWQPIRILNTFGAMQMSGLFGGVTKEIADAGYIQPGVLTMPIPPILLKSCYNLALHSEIPRQQVKQYQPRQAEEVDGEGEGLDSVGEFDPSQGIPDIPKSRPGVGGYAPGGPMGPGSGMAGSSSGGGMYPGGGGMEDAGMYEGEDGGYEGGGPGMEGGYGSGMEGGYGLAGAQIRQPLVKHKMVRFFDLTAEPGKSYRYRVAVVLEDPNRPRDPNADPNERILDPKVVQRLKEVVAKDEADVEYVKKNKKPKRTYYRQTEWSELSNIVTIANPAKFVAGATTPAKTVTLPMGTKVFTTDNTGIQVEVELGQDTEVETTECFGKLVTVVWDKRRAAEVPVEKEVHRGEFLTFDQDADVLHPLSLQIKTIEKYPFDTDAFVADFRGGGQLITDVDEEAEEKTDFFTPGEFLVVDGEGNLIACNEIDDTEEYRRLLFIVDAPDSAMAIGGGYGGDMGGVMMGGGYGDMMEGSGADMYGGMMGGEEQ